MATVGKRKLATVNKEETEKKKSVVKDTPITTTVAPKEETTKSASKDKTKEAPQKSIAQSLMDLESTQRAAIEKKKVEQAKSLGRSADKSRRVSSSTRISGLRGLEPRLGMQFYKKKKYEE